MILGTAGIVGCVVATLVIFLLINWLIKKQRIAMNNKAAYGYEVISNFYIRRMTANAFLSKVAWNKKPFRFTKPQIVRFTSKYSTQLGAGHSYKVFKGALPNGLAVAVKVFHADLDINQGQFSAAVKVMWKNRHVNVVKLLGFCFDDAVRALVYEYVENGALDAYLLDGAGRDVGAPVLFDIAVGVARGIRYLHEECNEKVVQFDIKLNNVLLDGALTPKIVDIGIVPLVSGHTNVTLYNFPATRGYRVPEIPAQLDIPEKCDVYSFGMLLLEIVGRKRISDKAAPEGQRSWFPELAWSKHESGDLMDLLVVPSRDHDDVPLWKEPVERMCKVAFWCVQPQPIARPSMGDVVKMLKGEKDIDPPANPFQDTLAVPEVTYVQTKMTSNGDTMMTGSGNTATENGDFGEKELLDKIIEAMVESDGS